MARIRTIKPETASSRWRRADLHLATHPEVVLYRLFDASGALLYVGVSRDPFERLRRHAQKKEWWAEVARIDLSVCATYRTALTQEREAIAVERPLHNTRSAVR